MPVACLLPALPAPILWLVPIGHETLARPGKTCKVGSSLARSCSAKCRVITEPSEIHCMISTSRVTPVIGHDPRLPRHKAGETTDPRKHHGTVRDPGKLDWNHQEQLSLLNPSSIDLTLLINTDTVTECELFHRKPQMTKLSVLCLVPHLAGRDCTSQPSRSAEI